MRPPRFTCPVAVPPVPTPVPSSPPPHPAMPSTVAPAASPAAPFRSCRRVSSLVSCSSSNSAIPLSSFAPLRLPRPAARSAGRRPMVFRCDLGVKRRLPSGEGAQSRSARLEVALGGVGRLQEGDSLAGQIGRFLDRKSTRLNSRHVAISYAVFCLKQETVNVSDDLAQRLEQESHDSAFVTAAV